MAKQRKAGKNMMNNKFILNIAISFVLVIFLSSFVVGNSTTVDIHIYAYTGSTTVMERTCYDLPDENACTLVDLTQQNCCWADSPCNWGGIPGNYYLRAEIREHEVDDGEIIHTIQDYQSSLFECLDDGVACYEDIQCVTEYCVKGNVAGDEFCRETDPWCGDQYCDNDQLETCLGATRDTDVRSCPDDPICKQYVCEGGCSLKNLDAGDYTEEYPYPYGAWSCNECTHCDGEGECVSDCIDEDEDGYGVQPDEFSHAECCDSGYDVADCDDTNYFVHPDAIGYVNPPSPYCDCNYNTGQGFTQGTAEGPINIAVQIDQDLCFDGFDNDCDGPEFIDCYDPDCSPEGYIYPITNRTCYDDCNSYTTDIDNDRACCPNPSDCVINGRCVQSGDVDGSFPDAHYCYNGKWYGGDTFSQVCALVIEDEDYNPIQYSHWNLPGDAGNESCCGDDPNEYFTAGAYGSYACCAAPDMNVVGGVCMGSLVEKEMWDKSGTGYCAAESQCIVNPNENSFEATVEDATDLGNPLGNKIRCINDKESIGDHYCNNGKWTSRTALVATQMADFAKSMEEASLFCDSYDKVLNYYAYDLQGTYAEHYLGTEGFQCKLGTTNIPCTNNMCVLRYKEGDSYKVVLGTSLNHDIDAPIYSILEVLGGGSSDCNNQKNSTTFSSCRTGIFYNNNIKSVIYSKDSISLGNVLVGNLLYYMENVYSPILNYVKSQNPSSYDYNFVIDTQDFNKIYLSKKGDKVISIITEEIEDKKYMSATYSNFKTDICKLIDNYIESNPKLIPLDCIKDGSNTFVVTGGLSKGYYDLLDDLGPKLRIE